MKSKRTERENVKSVIEVQMYKIHHSLYYSAYRDMGITLRLRVYGHYIGLHCDLSGKRQIGRVCSKSPAEDQYMQGDSRKLIATIVKTHV